MILYCIVVSDPPVKLPSDLALQDRIIINTISIGVLIIIFARFVSQLFRAFRSGITSMQRLFAT